MVKLLVIVAAAVSVWMIQYCLGIKITSTVISPVAANIVNYAICGLAGAAITKS